MRRLTFVLSVVIGCSGDDVSKVPPTDDTNDGLDQDGDGYSVGQGDCDDNDGDVFPGANDIVGDDVDTNCDDIDGIDNDRDGQASQGSGGADCNDEDDTIYDRAPEIGWDGVDQDCDDEDRYDFVDLGAGKFHTCGVASDGHIECWGSDEFGQISTRPTEGVFIDVDAGSEFSCAVEEGSGALRCWGRDENGSGVSGIVAPPAGEYTAVALGHYFGCALDRTGKPVCWGDDLYRQVSDTPVDTEFTTIAAGGQHVCGVRKIGGGITCWGSDTEDQVGFAPTDGPNLRVVSGSAHSCGVRVEQNITCWGSENKGQTEPVFDPGPYTWVSSFADATCGVISNRDLTCWGADGQGQVGDAPLAEPTELVEMGDEHACRISADNGHVGCWGKNTEGQATSPWP